MIPRVGRWVVAGQTRRPRDGGKHAWPIPSTSSRSSRGGVAESIGTRPVFIQGEDSLPDAVIVSTARTPLAARTAAPSTTRTAPCRRSRHPARRPAAGVEPGEVEDVILGCRLPGRRHWLHIARQSAIRGRAAWTTAGVTVNRFSPPPAAIAMAAQRVIVDRVPVIGGGRLESISLVQNEHMNLTASASPGGGAQARDLHGDDRDSRSRAKRYYITRETQDEYALSSQQAHGGRPGRRGASTRRSSRCRRRRSCRQGQRPVTRGSGHPQAGRGQPRDTTAEGLAALQAGGRRERA